MTANTRARRAQLPGSVCLTALVLTALTLCALLCARPARAAEWMSPYLEQVQEWGVMRGDAQGNLNEDRNITRAEFVTLVNRAFGYTEAGPNTFTDVRPNDWFAEDISIAHQAGYFNGTSPTTASPYSLVTREQAAVLLGRCLRFQGVTGAANSTFTDMQDIGGWSRGLVQEAADLGIIQGYADGSFRPGLPITRGQMACFLVRALGTLVQEPGEQTTGGVYGNLTITTPGVKLKDTTVTGNLYLTGGVGLGNVELENVNVLGKIVICGGGEAERGDHSVILRNVTAGSLEVDSLTEQFLSIEAEGLTNIGTTTVRSSAYVEDRTEDGLGLQTLRLDGVDGSQFQLAGNLKRVINLTPESMLQVAQGVADVVTVDEKAVDSTLTIDNLGSIRELNLDRGTQVTGPGSVSHLNINAPGSNVSMLPDTIYIRPGITGVVNRQNMDNKAAAESSEDPRLLAGYPKARNIAPTSADAVFRTNKTGTIRWAVTTLMDGSLGEEELMNPSAYAKILRSGTINATASDTDFTARLTGLTREGSYYISALLEDARGRRSPVKIAAFTTPDDTAPNFANGYPQTPILTVDADNEQVAQVLVMATKDCQMYYVLLPRGSTAPTAADFRSAALPGNLGYGIVTLRKNTPFLVSRINSSHLQEQTTYDLYLWLSDADNGKSSAVRRLQVTTKDLTPPTIQDLKVTSYTARSVTLSFMLDEPGTLNWVVVKRGDNFGINIENPSKLDQIKIEGVMVGGKVIRKGGPVRAARAATAYTFTVSGLEGQTEYDLFYTFKDTAGNYGVYNKTIAFPFPIKTQDNEGPTASLSYSDFNTDSNGVEHPWADSDISIDFSEPVLGAKNSKQGLYDNFLEAYQRVQSTSGEQQIQAKKDLSSMLRDYITLCTGSAPSNINTKPREETWVKNKESLTPDQLESEPAWIDFREAVVTQENGKTSIRFPGKVGTQLQSGQYYYFWIRNIEDTSTNTIKPNPTYLRFNSAFATVNLAYNEVEETATYVDSTGTTVTRPAKIFYTMPENTEAVSKDTRWDMIIWTPSNIEYDLLVRLRNGTSWYNLGTISANLPTDAKRVYNSLNGNFNNSTNHSLIDSGLFGTVQEGQGRPFLNEYVDQLEFAVVPSQKTVDKRITLEVQLFAGSNSQIGNLAQSQRTAINPDWTITPIGEPDPFPLPIDPSDEAPTITVGRGGITPRDNYTTIDLNLSRSGTVFYAAVLLDNVEYDPATNEPIGDKYILGEETNVPRVDGKQPDLRNVSNSTTSPVAHLKLDSDAPNPLYVVQQRYFTDSNTKLGSLAIRNENDPRGTLRIDGLKSEQTYLIYLVATNTDGTPSKNALCFKVTTTPPNPPKMLIEGTASQTASITVNPQSTLRYVLVDHRALTGTALYSPFREYADMTKNPPESYLNMTVLEAMKTQYQEPREEDVDPNGLYNSIFDIYTSQTTKDFFWTEILAKPATYFGDENVAMTTMASHNRLLTSTGNFGLTGMGYQVPYVLLVGAKPDRSTNYAFQSAYDYRQSAIPNLQVVDWSFDMSEAKHKGTLTIIFNQDPYFTFDSSSSDPDAAHKIDNCTTENSGQHCETGDRKGAFVNIGSIASSSHFAFSYPTPNTKHNVQIGTELQFEVDEINVSNTMRLSFNSGLCNSRGATVKDTAGGPRQLIITVTRRIVAGETTYDVTFPAEWGYK